MAPIETSDLATRHAADPDHQLPPSGDGTGADTSEDLEKTGLITLLRDLAEDTRTLVQQEIALAKMEAAHTAKRVAVDSAWIGAGALILIVGGLCLVLALALGLGALLGSYWLGTLITAAVLLLVGALAAWKGIHDLKKGGFAPTETVESLQEDRSWAEGEVDDLKRALKKE